MKLRVQYARQLTPAELEHYLGLGLLELPADPVAFLRGASFDDASALARAVQRVPAK